MPADWYYAADNEQHGPFTADELKQHVDAGRLQPYDYVWQEGMPEWVEARTVRGLFSTPPPLHAGQEGSSAGGPHAPAFDAPDLDYRPWGMDVRTFCLLLHLGQFAGYAVPMAGFVLPIVMWATEKDKSPEIDQHGRIVVNWMISSMIYLAVGFVLTFVLIGIPILLVTLLLAVVYPIVGGIKAQQGEVWKYPLTIRFF